jgi:hypothetical protein
MLNSETYKYSSKTNHCWDRSEYGGGEVMRALLPNPENPDRSEGVAVICGAGDDGASNAGGLPGVCGRCTAAGGPDESFEEAGKYSVSSGSELPLLKM